MRTVIVFVTGLAIGLAVNTGFRATTFAVSTT
jgi:acid phosphatase family membrane protein YuiD